MNSNSSHIQNLVFDIDFPLRDEAYQLQNKISRLFTYQLQGLLQEFFEEKIPPHFIVKVETLTLDLGSIAYEHLDKELPEKLLQALQQAFNFSFIPGSNAIGSFPSEYAVITTETGYLRLLCFFLQTGTLPWWAGAVSKDQLESFIELLCSQHSRQLRTVLMAEGKNELVRRRMAWQFSEKIIKKIITVIEPEEALFIFAYHKSITRQQQQYNLVKSGTEDFKRAIWLFILSFLLAERETWFNRRVFIKSTLRQMAAHFNLQYGALIALLYQALYATGEDIEQAKLTWFIKLVLEEELQQGGIGLPVLSETQQATQEVTMPALLAEITLSDTADWWDRIPLFLQLKNILACFIQTGTVPARGKHATQQMTALLEQLMAQHPLEAVALLQWAGADEKRKNRFLYQFPERIILQLISYLPSGKEAVRAHQYMLDLVMGHAGARPAGVPAFNVAKTLLRLVWSHYANAGYQSFQDTAFYIQALKYLYRLPAAVWFHLLPAFNELFSRRDTKGLQQMVQALAGMNEQSSLEAVASGLFQKNAPAAIKKAVLLFGEQEYQSLSLLSSTTTGDQAYNIEDPVRAAAGTLAYFLTWNQLPATLESMERKEADILLTEMMLFLFTKDRAGLSALLSAPANSYAAKKRIYRLFQPQRGGKDALVARFLEGFMQADLAAYLQEAPFITSTVQQKEVYKGYTMARVAVLLHNYYNIGSSRNAGAAASSWREQDLLQQALSVLDYFFTWNSLPPGLEVSLTERSFFIQYLFRWVFGKSAASLNTLLQKRTHQVTARVQMHSWFEPGEFVNGSSIVAFTALWLEQDVLQYLDQHTGVTIAEVPAWQQLVSWQQMPVAVISYLARRYQVNTILQWLQQGNSAWLINIQPALELLQVLFSHLSGLAGDWPRLLLNECLLLSFSGHVTVNGTAAFIQLFFTLVDKNTAPPAYKVYEKIQDALLLIRPPETPVAQGLVRVIEKEVKQRLLQRPALLSLPAPVNMPPTGLTVTAVKDPPVEAVSRIYAGNAGLVLLHPFFNIFFSRLHLVEKGKFVSDTAMHRAAHLLQYLVDGLPEHEEHLLVLNKLLCGIPLNDPLPLEIELLPEEIELANELFRILFLQWDKMKNTTIDGFRQSFLQRQGVLSHNADHWVLRVEQRGYDMLLQTLPWGYSTIRLPWMKELLYVEWI